MIETISGQGGDLLSSVEAGRRFGYTNDYVARLARKGKVRAVRIGHEWLVDRESLGQFVVEAKAAKREHAARIPEERRREFRAAAQSRQRLMMQRAHPRQRGFVLVRGIILAAIGVLLGFSLFTTASLLEAPRAVDSQKQHHSAPSISKGYSGLARTITYTAGETAEASVTARFRFHLPSLSLPVLPEIDVRAAVGTVFLELSDGLRFAMRELWCDATSLFKDDACADAPTPVALEPVLDEPPAPVPAPVSVSTPIATPAPAPTPAYTTVASDTHITNITKPTTIVREYHEIEVEREPRVRRVLFDGQVDQIYDDMQEGFGDIGDSIDDEFGSIGESFATELLTVSSNTDLGGTLAVAGAVTFDTTLQVLGDTTLTTLTVNQSTTTNATSTTFYATTARGTDLVFTNADFGSLAADAASSTDFYATRAIFGSATSTNLVATNATTTNFYTSIFNTDTASIADLTVSEFVATSATSTNLFVANFVASAATTTDFFTTRLAVDSLSLSSGITSHFVPSANDTYDLGSPSFYWRNGYIDTITVNSISAASTSIGGTASESFTINSDNATADTEDMSLIFYRGAVVPNAVITWDAAEDRFEFNQPAYISNQSGSTTASTLTLQGVPGQTGDIFRIASSTGNTVFGVAYDGAVTISTSTIAALSSGTTTITHLTVSNTSTSTFAGGLSTARLGVSGAATFDSLLSLSGSGANIALGSNWLSGDGDDEGITINTAGEVGVGTAPEGGIRIAVGGDARFRGSVMINGNGVDHPILYMDQNAGPTTVQFNTNGDSYLTGGNLGIGTDSPSVRLDVRGDAYIGGSLTATGTLSVAGITSTATSTATYFAASTLGTADAPAFTFSGDVNTGMWSSGADTLALSAGGTERVTITSAGNIGIGTSTPADILTIERNTSASNALTLINTSGGTAAAAGVRMFNDYSSGLASLRAFGTGYTGVASWQDSFVINTAAGLSGGIKLQASTGGITLSASGLEANDFVVSSSGNVGIGTSNPTRLFTVGDGTGARYASVNGAGTGASAGSAYLLEQGGTLYGALGNASSVLGGAFSNDLVLYNASSSATRFYTGATERMRIDASGDVGIGTTDPQTKLQVSKAAGGAMSEIFRLRDTDTGLMYRIRLDGSAERSILFDVDSSDSGFSNVMAFKGGNVGIGTTSPASTLAVAGNQYITGTLGIGTNAMGGSLMRILNTSTPYLQVSDGTRLVNFGVDTADTTNSAFVNSSTGMKFLTNSGVTQAMTILTGGNVGIGTTTPGSALHVAGNVLFGANNPGGGIYMRGSLGSSYSTATTPDYSWAWNDQTGVFHPAGDTIGFTTGGTERLRVTSTGNVGIGTTTPGYELTVQGNAQIYGGNLYTPTELQLLNGANAQGAKLGSLWVSDGYSGTAPTNGAYIKGNVGIGSTTPYAKLAVKGAGSTTGVNFQTTNSSDSPLFTILDSGLVGIGTAAPVSALQVVTASLKGTGINVGPTATGNLVNIYGNASSGGTVHIGTNYFTSDGALGIGTWTTPDAVTIATGGNVGIGTTTPNGSLIVYNSGSQVNAIHSGIGLLKSATGDYQIQITNPSGGQPHIDMSATANRDYDFRQIFTASTNRFEIISSSTAAVSIHGNGSIRFGAYGAGTLTTDASGNITASSDERLKNFEGIFSKGLAEVLLLEPINFTWKASTGFDTANVYTGFSAQNVQLAIPEAIGEDKHGFLTLSERPILAAVVNAIKELYEGITLLQTTVADFATEFYSNRLRTDELCVGATCVTEAELQALLVDRDIDASAGDSPVSGDTTSDSEEPADIDADATDSEPSTEEPGDLDQDTPSEDTTYTVPNGEDPMGIDAGATDSEPSTEGPGDLDQDTPPEAPPEEAPPTDPDPAPETIGGE